MTAVSRRSPTALRPRLLLTLAAAVGFGGLGVAAVLPHEPGEAAHLRDVRAAIAGSRAAGPRLSVTPHHRPCADRPGLVPRSSCAPPRPVASPDGRVLELAARASAGVRGELGARSLHRAGLVDLLWSGERGIRIDAAISSLEHAVRLADRPAPVLADLAGAFLLRAERDQSPRDVLLALEAAERALAEEPEGRVALFNRALALERLGLGGAAADSWLAYAEADPRSDWGAEAAERARGLVPPPPPEPPAEADAGSAAAFAAAAPQEALSWGLATALGEWAAAVLAGDETAAERWLGAAEAAGARLVRDGRDASLADAAAAARGSAGAERVALARAHAAYAEAARLFANEAHLEAGPLVQPAGTSGASPALRGWMGVMRAAVLGYGEERAAAYKLALGIAERTDSVRHPALAARARWIAGTMTSRDGRYEEALEWFERAGRLYARAGAKEEEGVMAYLSMDARLGLGDAPGAWENARGALVLLQSRPTSPWLRILLTMGAHSAAEEGLLRAALALQAQSIRIPERGGQASSIANARLAYGRLLLAAGEPDYARREVEAAASRVDRIASEGARAWYSSEVRLARALTWVASDPRAAAALLDTVVLGYEGQPARLPYALLARADARARSGDESGAVDDLENAARLHDAVAETVSDPALRRSLAERARPVWDRLTMTMVAADRPGEALERLEWGRASFGARSAGAKNALIRPPPGEGALSYALVGDTLLVWALEARHIRLARSTIPRGDLVRTAERVRVALELRTGDAAVRQDLARLYDWLVRPIEDWLPPSGGALRIVADGEISAVPFAALLDQRRNRYLVEDHPLRFTSSLVSDTHGRSSTAGEVLLIADPDFDRAAHPGLPRLSAAADEVREIASTYGGARVLSGSEASPAGLGSALDGAGIVHYAGHAVFDDVRPERSYLVLSGAGERGLLRAEEAERMDLGEVRLVVLSACETVRASDGRGGGFAGFARALLQAGAGGVVGSTWRVEDEATRRLMVAFHQRYRASSDGATALREAQLAMLRSSEPAHRSVATWASFRYTGN